MKNDVTQGSYTCSFDTIGKSSIPENLDPFRRQFPDKVINKRNACEAFIDADTEKQKRRVAKKYGFEFEYLSAFCKNKYRY